MKSNTSTLTKKILVVDDEPEIRQSLQMILEDCGFISKTAGSGQEALDTMDQEDFDMVITDIRMPNMGGLDLIEELRQKNQKIPVLIITAYVYREMAVRGLQMGATGYLFKPIDFDELIGRVESLLNI